MYKKASILLFCVAVSSCLIASPVDAGIDGGAKSGFTKGVNDAGGSGAGDLMGLIRNVINTLLFVAGVAAVVVIVIGGFRFVTSEGDSQATNKARNTVIYAAIGLVVAVSAYAIVNFILDQLS